MYHFTMKPNGNYSIVRPSARARPTLEQQIKHCKPFIDLHCKRVLGKQVFFFSPSVQENVFILVWGIHTPMMNREWDAKRWTSCCFPLFCFGVRFSFSQVFVANPNKTQPIIDILLKNQTKLIDFLSNFQKDRTDDEQFNDEKTYLIKQIRDLKKPAS